MSESKSGGGMPPMVNKLMKVILRSPLHGMLSKYITLITFTGRKSGTVYTTPVSYSRVDDLVMIFSHADWWRNMQGGADVTLHLRGRSLKGAANPVVEDKAAIAASLAAHLRKQPFDAKFYDVEMKDGNPDADDVAEAVKTVVMIPVSLNPEK